MQDSSNLTFKTFIVLLTGFLILFTSVFFIITSYLRISRSNLTPQKITNEIIRVADIFQNVSTDKVLHVQHLLRHPGIWTSISNTPPDPKITITEIKFKTIHDKVMQHPDNIDLAFPLPSNLYLHVKTHIDRSLILKFQFFAAIIVWLAALIAFCYYIVRRLSMPLAHFIEGANRFSQDINAPPLAEVGPTATRFAFQAFNHMQSNLKQLIQNRTQMLAAISHDLRTPITRLKLRLENLSHSETTDKMQQDLDQMEKMIQSILNFAQDEYQYEQAANLNLTALCESICEDMQDMNLAVTMKDNDQKIICVGRTVALRRALTNLITNGVKYGKEVSVEITTQDKQAKIIINDKGPGIPENQLEQVFLPFYRIDKSRHKDTGGTGLGLASARDIIRSHGGDIELHNLPQGGLSAVIRLPLLS